MYNIMFYKALYTKFEDFAINTQLIERINFYKKIGH